MPNCKAHDQRVAWPIVISMMVLMTPMCGATQDKARLFGDHLIMPPWLAALDAEIRITADSVKWRGAEFRNIHMPINVKWGIVAIDDARAELADGHLTATVKHDPGSITTLSVRGDAVELGRMPALNEYLSDLPVDVTVDLRGTGTTPHNLAASVDGAVYLRNTASGTINKLLKLPNTSSVTDFLSKLNPFRGEARVTSVECLAIDLPVVNGVIDDDHLFEMMTDIVIVKAAAQIDLGSETVYAAFMPEARNDVTLSNLATGDVVVIEGDLSAPEIGAMKGHGLEKGVSLGGAIAKLGPSKLFSLIGDTQIEASLCADGAALNEP